MNFSLIFSLTTSSFLLRMFVCFSLSRLFCFSSLFLEFLTIYFRYLWLLSSQYSPYSILDELWRHPPSNSQLLSNSTRDRRHQLVVPFHPKLFNTFWMKFVKQKPSPWQQQFLTIYPYSVFLFAFSSLESNDHYIHLMNVYIPHLKNK